MAFKNSTMGPLHGVTADLEDLDQPYSLYPMYWSIPSVGADTAYTASGPLGGDPQALPVAGTLVYMKVWGSEVTNSATTTRLYTVSGTAMTASVIFPSTTRAAASVAGSTATVGAIGQLYWPKFFSSTTFSAVKVGVLAVWKLPLTA